MEVIVTAQVSLLPAATAPRKVSMVFLIAITRSAGLGSCMKLEVYHWQELPQVRFLLRQKFCCDKHMFVMTNTCLSWQTCLLLWQKYACHNKTFVMTNIFLLQQNFRHNKQRYAFHDKTFVSTNMFVMTNICCDKSFVTTKIFCRDKHNFVTTKDVFWVWAHSQCTGRYLFWNGCMDTMGAITPVTYSVCVLRQSAGIGKSRNLRYAPACILSYWEPIYFVRIHHSRLFEANSFQPTNLMHNILQPL